MFSRCCWLAVLLLVVCSFAEEECPAAGRCSACERFVESYYEQSGKVLGKRRSTFQVYKERIEAIYATHAPEKVAGAGDLLKKTKKQHDLYVRICTKYNEEPEAPYAVAVSPDEARTRRPLLEKALAGTVDALEGQQWAQSEGPAGDIAFVDFQKAMSGGSITGSISMGPDVTQKMRACFAAFIKDHRSKLLDAMASAKRPTDSKLHRSFCKDTARACGGAPPPQDDVDVNDPDGFFEL